MNTLLICWLTRRIIRHRADDNLALPGWARRHAENCRECRHRYDLEMEIVRQLSEGPASRGKVTAPFLHARIIRAINEERGGHKRVPARAPLGWWFAGTAACALLAVALWVPRGIYHSHPIDPQTFRMAQALSGLPRALKLPDQTQVRRWIGKVDGPLENEMNLVVDDAKTAFNSLAADFLLADDRR